jgi:hypothetical protein
LAIIRAPAGRHLHHAQAQPSPFLPLHHNSCPSRPPVFLLALVSLSTCSGARCGCLSGHFLRHTMAQPSGQRRVVDELLCHMCT